MEQNPSWEANRSIDSQGIPRILWNPKVHYCILPATRACPVPDWSILFPLSLFLKIHVVHTVNLVLYHHLLWDDKHNVVHKSWSINCNKHFNITLVSKPSYLKRSLAIRLSHQNPVCTSPISHACYMSPHSRFNHPNNILWAVQIIKLLIM